MQADLQIIPQKVDSSKAALRFGSVCSGIEAASVAWEPLGWKASFLSEIDKFPRAVLSHHYPKVPLHGDFTTIQAGDYDPIDLLVGGTPCQSFSVAGLRGGLADGRGNLALEYLKLAQRLRPKWLVWENVPGVLSSAGGRDFGSILGGLVELGYGFAYRVLDAQYFGVPQRRRRVFVVGCAGDWRRAAAVLFERHSLQGHSPPRREAGQRAAPTISARTEGGGGLGTDFDLDGGLIARCVTAREGQRQDWETETLIAHSLRAQSQSAHDTTLETCVSHALRADGFDASEDGTGRGTPLVPVQPYMLAVRGRGHGHNLEYRQDGTSNAILTPNGGRAGMGVGAIAYAIQERAGSENPDAGPDGAGYREGAAYTLEARQTPQAVAYAENQRCEIRELKVAGAVSSIRRGDAKNETLLGGSAVRRLTPRECERLQGFPDDYTLISHRGKPAADGPRYKALGNSMAVPVMSWIGQRIAMVEALNERAAA